MQCLHASLLSKPCWSARWYVANVLVAVPHNLLWRCRWLRYTPFKFFWDPRLAFTGITILGYNGDTGTHVKAAALLMNRVCIGNCMP